MNRTLFPELDKRLGFGFMRLPTVDGEVDVPKTCAMVDRFLARGFRYFDTAHGYHEGRSEGAIRACLTSRHPREAYLLANKLSGGYFKSEADIRPLFAAQLAACGVEYFDVYLFHALDAESYEHFKACRAFETVRALKAEGKIRHVAMSFHDRAEVLDRILTEQEGIEAVQLQFNYLDYYSDRVQSGACYEVCVKHGKPVLVMEPVKGGRLAQLPAEAGAALEALGGGSPASYALRFCAQFPQVSMILSGMGSMEMVEDNTAIMDDPAPLSGAEQAALDKVRAVLTGEDIAPCTACRYCVEGCPAGIPIPDVIASLNQRRRGGAGDCGYAARTEGAGQASACVKCGKCEQICPQHLEIRALMERAAAEFE